MDVNEEISKFILNHGTGSVLPGKSFIPFISHLYPTFLLDIPKYTKFKRETEMVLKHQEKQPVRTIKEINIPTKHDEQLRSVNDQLKKIPSPWDNDDSNSPKVSFRLQIVQPNVADVKKK